MLIIILNTKLIAEAQGKELHKYLSGFGYANHIMYSSHIKRAIEIYHI